MDAHHYPRAPAAYLSRRLDWPAYRQEQLPMTDTDVVETLASADIRFLRVPWCDNANVIRAKAIHRDALPHHMACGVGISPAQQALPVMFDAPVADSGLGPVATDWRSWPHSRTNFI